MDWLEQGKPDKTALLFLHGFPDVAETWFPLTEQLKNDFYCLCPEILPADISGKSAGLQARAFEIIKFISDKNVKKFHLVGHDLGAPLAWRVAELMQGQCLSLTIMGGLTVQQMAKRLLEKPRQRKMSWYLPLMQMPALPELASRFLGPRIEKYIQTKGRHPHQVTKDGLARFGLYREYAKELSFGKAQEKISCPLNLMWGLEDAFVLPPNKKEFEGVSPKLSMQILEGGHWFYLEDPKGVAQCLRQYYQMT